MSAVLFCPAAVRAQERAFLGVHVRAVPDEVRAQTSLADGAGLLIDFIQPGSPAETAGLKVHDILVAFGDQKLLSSLQFESLVKSAKPGQEILLQAMRQGRVEERKVSLGRTDAKTPPLPAAALKVQPDVIEQMTDLLRNHPEASRLLPEILQRLKDGREHAAGAASQMMTDGDGTVEIRQMAGRRTATVKNKSGETLFEGPWDTEHDRSAPPADIRQRLEKLERSARQVTSGK